MKSNLLDKIENYVLNHRDSTKETVTISVTDMLIKFKVMHGDCLFDEFWVTEKGDEIVLLDNQEKL